MAMVKYISAFIIRALVNKAKQPLFAALHVFR